MKQKLILKNNPQVLKLKRGIFVDDFCIEPAPKISKTATNTPGSLKISENSKNYTLNQG